MSEDFQLDRFDSKVLEKYINAPEKYTMENDTLIKENNGNWIIIYYRNPSCHNVISVLHGGIPEEEQNHWEEQQVGVARYMRVNPSE